ncbi:MAG: GNAT family N-acetyltransferase [Gammaproteobacteria bacterium]|nr:MAG: GNAT family N-acetyltransferase [Gammaproteobacteria bacterium]
MTEIIKIIEAGVEDIDQIAPLFDCYRQFYKQPEDLELAKSYITERLKTGTAIIFLARDEHNNALGFTQLYKSYCSIDVKPIWILYDLFVVSSARKKGVGKALMDRALLLAKETGAARIDLETAYDNSNAQALYESLGYQRDDEYYKYSLEL